MAGRTMYISAVNQQEKSELVAVGRLDKTAESTSQSSEAPAPRLLSKTFVRLKRGRAVVGDVLYAQGGSFGPRRQADFQLVVVHRGSFSVAIDGEVLEVAQHFAVLLSPGHTETFTFAADRETRHSWIAVEPALLSESLRRELKRSRGPAPFVGRVAAMLDAARQDAAAAPETEALMIDAHEALATSILCAFAATVLAGKRPGDPSDDVLQRMERFIAEEYARPVTLKDIARAAGASRQHLLKLCRAAGKSTPTKLLYIARLEAAAHLLLHTGFSIAQVAEQCGFTNQFHFSRKFKQEYGSSPYSWRVQAWKKQRYKK